MVVSLRRLTRHPARLAGARPFGGNTPRGPVLTPEATRPRGHHGDRRADRGRPARLSEAVVFRRCARPARDAGPGDRWMVAALGRVPLHPEDVLPRTERSYKNLNMRSTRSERESPDDRSTKARIRDAAIDCVAEHGVAATTARRVAAAAGVSTGLVIHHFGSMEGLRSECDEYVAAAIRRRTTESMSAGLDPLAALRDADLGPLMSYLVRVLAEDSPSVNALVDEMVADAEEYLQRGVEIGMLRPSADPRGRAAVLTLWSLGGLVLHRHLERILCVDLTAPDLGSDPAITGYIGPAMEILGEGVLTESFTRQSRESLARPTADDVGTAPSVQLPQKPSPEQPGKGLA